MSSRATSRKTTSSKRGYHNLKNPVKITDEHLDRFLEELGKLLKEAQH